MSRHDGIFDEFERWGWDQRNWQRATRRHYRYHAEKADRWLHEHRDRCLVRADTSMLTAFLASTSSHPGSRNRIRQALIAFYRYCEWRGRRRDNPAASIARLPEPQAIPKALTIREARAVAVSARAEGLMWHLMVLTFLYTGLRHEEVRTLHWASVEESDGHHWARQRVKGGRERVVPLHPLVAAALARWRAASHSARWVFPSPLYPSEAVSQTTIRARITDIGRAAGLDDLHPHQLRHTYATRLLERGVDIRTVQEALGHVELSSTQVYLRVRPSRIADAVSLLDFAQAA